MKHMAVSTDELRARADSLAAVRALVWVCIAVMITFIILGVLAFFAEAWGVMGLMGLLAAGSFSCAVVFAANGLNGDAE